MNLTEFKLNSDLSNLSTAEARSLLENSRVTISWYGQRKVSVLNCEGSLEINEFANKLFSLEIFKKKFNTEEPSKSLSVEERLEAFRLRHQLRELYKNSLNNTCLYKYIIPIKDEVTDCITKVITFCIESFKFGPIQGLQNLLLRQSKLKINEKFACTSEEYAKLWPKEIYKGKVHITGTLKRYIDNEKDSHYFTVSQKLINQLKT